MLTDELLRLASSQPEVRETRRVQVWGTTLRASVDSGELRRLDKILSHPDQTSELKTFRYAHLLGPALGQVEIDAWQRRFPSHPLPSDLAAFLRHVDGVHFWADLDFGRAYFGIAPLAEWQDAASASAPVLFQEQPEGVLIISYHENGDYYAVLDTAASVYRWIDPEDIGHPENIGTSLAEVLDWFWVRASEFRPAVNVAG